MYRQSEPLHGRPPPRRRGHDVVAGGSTSGVTPEGQGWPRGLSFGGRLCCQPTITCTTCWWMHGGGADRHAALAPMARWLRQRAVGKRVARHLEAVAVSMDRRRSPDTAKPRRWLLRSSGRRGSRCRGQGRRWLAGAGDSAFARGQEKRREAFRAKAVGDGGSVIRRFPQRRLDGLPARD